MFQPCDKQRELHFSLVWNPLVSTASSPQLSQRAGRHIEGTVRQIVDLSRLLQQFEQIASNPNRTSGRVAIDAGKLAGFLVNTEPLFDRMDAFKNRTSGFNLFGSTGIHDHRKIARHGSSGQANRNSSVRRNAHWLSKPTSTDFS